MPSSRAPHCPRCNGLTRVTNTFYEKGSERNVIRQRLCLHCGHEMTTRQSPERVLPASTIKWPSDLTATKLVEVIPIHRLMKKNRLVNAES